MIYLLTLFFEQNLLYQHAPVHSGQIFFVQINLLFIIYIMKWEKPYFHLEIHEVILC